MACHQLDPYCPGMTVLSCTDFVLFTRLQHQTSISTIRSADASSTTVTPETRVESHCILTNGSPSLTASITCPFDWLISYILTNGIPSFGASLSHWFVSCVLTNGSPSPNTSFFHRLVLIRIWSPYQPDRASDRPTAAGRREIRSAGGLGPRGRAVRVKNPRAVPLVITRAGTPVSNVIAAQIKKL
ncbi:hypothetical protein Bbelb_052460 [Branchiostoma belcheri]|nr:hypothetical protein Bbelb_052460 [Branchiostoma belcheri]